jgi:hypothetical protein
LRLQEKRYVDLRAEMQVLDVQYDVMRLRYRQLAAAARTLRGPSRARRRRGGVRPR